MTDREIVLKDLEAIYIGNLYTVEADLSFPAEGRLGSSINWESSFKHIIDDEGKVTRPRVGTGNRKVTLTATAVKGDVSEKRVFEATVLEAPSRVVVVAVEPLTVTIKKGEDYRLPDFVVVRKEGDIFGTAAVEWKDIPDFSKLETGTYKVTGNPLQMAPSFTPSAAVTVAAQVPDAKIERYELKAEEFKLDDARLLPGYLDENRKRFEAYLLDCDDDSMLYNFRAASGLSTKGAVPMTGWDAPESNLRGHTTGHYLSGIALASQGSAENKDAFLKKIDYMVNSLAECQDAFEASGKYAPGFLSGYSEEQFDRLEEYEVYPKIWAPYYTLHKILAGLLDCYEFAGNAKALKIAERVGTWTYERLSKCSSGQLAKMWAMYIAGEFGGMNETLARLYKFSPKQEYLTAAKYFDNEKLFMPMAWNVNTLCDMHANQHVPQIIGAMEIYNQTGEVKYFDVAKNFWNFVTKNHSFHMGGSGEGEMFKEPNRLASYLTDKNAESCVSYNMLKLSRMLFKYEPTSEYMDYYERAFVNHISGGGDMSGPTGGSTYFTPLLPGGKKEYNLTSNSCCHGTGLENHVKYQDSFYFYKGDTLYVNLFFQSELNWAEKGIKVAQDADYLKEQKAAIKVSGNGHIDLRVRIPGWFVGKPAVSLNGQNIDYTIVDGYAVINRDFVDGDRVEMDLPFSFKLDRTPDDPNVCGLLYGPLVMVIDAGGNDFINLDIDKDFTGVKKTGDMELTYGEYKFIPLHLANHRQYHAYFKNRQ